VLDTSAFVPQYIKIREEIAERIRSGTLKPGDQIPSLRQICKDYGVSMMTARRVTGELLQEGLAARRDGVGVFVSGNRRRARLVLALIGFSEDGWRTNSDMFGQLVGGVAGASWENDAILSVIPINDAESAPNVLRSLLDEQPLDGVLLRTTGDVDPEILRLFVNQRIPLVSIKRPVEPSPLTYVISDDESGSFQATTHLLELGHRRIGLVVSNASQSTANKIENGYRRAHELHEIAVDGALIRRVPLALESLGHEATLSLLVEAQPPTAIFAASDLLALGVYGAANQAGLAIPKDLSVVGFDDQDFAARLVPPLTTLHLSYYDLGHAAGNILFGMIQGDLPTGPTLIHVGLVIRDSSSPYCPGKEAPAV
jgi:DNA-binding LacI/PurR family transcriptional regulator